MRIGNVDLWKPKQPITVDITLLPISHIEKNGVVYTPALPFDEIKVRQLLERRDYEALEAYGYTKSRADEARTQAAIAHAGFVGTRPYFGGILLEPLKKLRRFRQEGITMTVYVAGDYKDDFRPIPSHIDIDVNLQLKFDTYQELDEDFGKRLEMKIIDTLAQNKDIAHLFRKFPNYKWTLENQKSVLTFIREVIGGAENVREKQAKLWDAKYGLGQPI